MPERSEIGRWRKRVGIFLQRVLPLFLIFAAGIHGAADPNISKEYQVKAAYIFQFTKFIEWPAHRFPQEDTPIVIGVLGKNPFKSELEGIARSHSVNNRQVVVKYFASVAEAKSAHVLFVSLSEDQQLSEIIDELHGAGVVTVGETDAFSRAGGVIRFLRVEDKIQFDISTTGASAAGVKISSHLMNLAKVTRR